MHGRQPLWAYTPQVAWNQQAPKGFRASLAASGALLLGDDIGLWAQLVVKDLVNRFLKPPGQTGHIAEGGFLLVHQL